MPWSMKTRRPMVAPGWISMPVTKRMPCETKRGSQRSPQRQSVWRDAVELQRVKARIAREHFPHRSRGGVALEHALDVFPDLRKTFCLPARSSTCTKV
jgi:hypothetical protein